MKWVKTALYAVVILGMSCGEHEGFRSYHGDAQGTTFSIKYDYKTHDLEDEVDSILESMDDHFSTYKENSMISLVNQSSAPVEVDDIFTDLWEKCWDLNITSNGYFDPTLGPVLNLYNFDSEKEVSIDSSKIEEALRQTGMHLINIQNNKLNKRNKDVKLNLNAVAQGYSVDVIADFMEGIGVKNYMVEIGGELRVRGVNDKGETWIIGIDKPLLKQERELLLKLPLKDLSLATSGNYRKFKRINGKNAGHIINPQTGYSEQSNVLSVSVLSSSCYEADGMATAFMNMHVEDIIQIEADSPDLSVIVIYLESSDTLIYTSQGIKAEHLN